MKAAYDPETLAEEVELINKDVTEEDFRFYFRHKDESTEPSPSGRHISHYKVTLASNKLVNLHGAMINTGLKTGQALEK